MAIVHVEQVSFAYEDSSPVLTDATLSVKRGSISVLMGPSGAGKTTLLRLIDLLETPTGGQIKRHFATLSGDATDRNPMQLRRKMSYVFQEPALFDSSVRSNVAYGPAVRRGIGRYLWNKTRGILPFLKRDGRDVSRNVNRVLDTVKLSGFQDRPVRSLSAGEQKRVSLARSLITNPELLLLDEPTTNLDPSTTATVEEVISRVRESDTTVFLATHDMNQAERIGDELFLLIDGEIIESGTTEDIFTNPANSKTADFVAGELVY